MGWCYCPSPCRQGSLCSNRHFLPTESCIWLEVTRGGRGKQSDVPPTLPSSFVISATVCSVKTDMTLNHINISSSVENEKYFGIMSLAEEWSAGPSLLRKRDWSTAYSPVFFARTWALTEEIESLARILMRMATKKVKKGENPPSPDSFYGQLHIYWEMEDPCARFSLELLARCRFFFFSSCFPASWIDAAADSPPTTNS